MISDIMADWCQRMDTPPETCNDPCKEQEGAANTERMLGNSSTTSGAAIALPEVWDATCC